jgi:hypothetical protein
LARCGGSSARDRQSDHDLVFRAKPREVAIIGFDFNRSKTLYEACTLPCPHDFADADRGASWLPELAREAQLSARFSMR